MSHYTTRLSKQINSKSFIRFIFLVLLFAVFFCWWCMFKVWMLLKCKFVILAISRVKPAKLCVSLGQQMSTILLMTNVCNCIQTTFRMWVWVSTCVCFLSIIIIIVIILLLHKLQQHTMMQNAVNIYAHVCMLGQWSTSVRHCTRTGRNELSRYTPPNCRPRRKRATSPCQISHQLTSPHVAPATVKRCLLLAYLWFGVFQ